MERLFYIAGVQHHQMNKVLDFLEEGMELELVPEPENKFDPNAVRIVFDGTMLGYVPKKFSSEVSGAIELGVELECIISKFNKSASPWEQCEVLISEIDEGGEVA